ncbi:hypothetical protein NEFER03_0915 [Nematocida sp. LUAm3]|nr:hypothetical protein NEFER03_0915 [Nematocida sp. LUAm3]KAI5174933.1 hypothetical protein NEFER02_1033 [Nematocida sp. LUAm2]KAI5177468.1 hypothetical protein NEFER01_0718 [Nematocida sp. LUAm1]
MEKTKSKSVLTITACVLGLMLLFSLVLGTESAEKEERRQTTALEEKYIKVDSLVNIIARTEDKRREEKKYAYKEQMIGDEDVLYVSIYSLNNYIDFLCEKDKSYYVNSSNWIKIMDNQLKRAKLIWIYLIQNNESYLSDCSVNGFSANCLFANIKGKNIVLETITICQYKEIIEPNYRYDIYINRTINPNYMWNRYVNRVKKLAAVWRHVLFEHRDGHILILYNPISNYKKELLLDKEPHTLLNSTLQIFMKENINFKKTFILVNDMDTHALQNDVDIPTMNYKKNNIQPNSIYELVCLMKYKLKSFLEQRAEKENKMQYTWFKKEVEDKRQYIERRKGITTDQDASNSITDAIDIGLTPIYFIYSGSQNITLPKLYFEIFLALSHPKMAKMYVNLFNQEISHGSYCINRYAPLYVDFSFCVINALHKDCIKEFFSQTEYLLIRDIDCTQLKLLLMDIPAFSSYANETPIEARDLAEKAASMIKIHVLENSNLNEFFPKISIKNIIYYITKHMIFMKSTIQLKLLSEEEKYEIFDVLVSKKEIIIEPIPTQTKITKDQNKTGQERIEDLSSREDLPCVKEVVNKLVEIQKSRSEEITILSHSYSNILDPTQPTANPELKGLLQTQSGPSSSTKKELKRKASLPSNDQAGPSAKTCNTSSTNRVND